MQSHRRNIRKTEKNLLFALTKKLRSYDILQARLCLCQVSSGSKQYEKVRHTNRISQYDLSTPRLSLLPRCPPPTHTHSIPSWHCWRWVAPKSHSVRRVGLQQPGPRLTCFNNFLPSSVKLCKYFSPVSSSLEHQLRVSVWFSWQLLSRLADSQASRWRWWAPTKQAWTQMWHAREVHAGKRYWWGEIGE